MSDAVLTDVHDRVLVITLNRPDARNAINAELAEGVIEAIDRLDRNDAFSVGVLTGAGKGFCSGMDLKAFAGGAPPTRFSEFIQNGARKPLIAAVEGFAVAGGLEIVLSCDLLVAAKGAKLGIPEVKVGLFAAGGGLLRLPQRLPYALAMEMALTGEPITAEDGHRHGLVSRLTEPGEALLAALELAGRIAGNAPLAMAASKRLVTEGQGLTAAEFWDLQKPHFSAVFHSQDAKEGPRAFAEKRPPAWTGR